MFGSLRGKRVTVMGLGRFGGGVGAVRYLAEQGARVTVTDRAREDQLAESLDAIADLRLERIRLGEHVEEDFRSAELIVASPAVPRDHPLLRSSRVPVTTEIGLFWSRCPARVIGVTGTVGKSTTSAMIHAVLVADGRRAWLGGNIGGSLLSEVAQIAADDLVVLELSSFQLEYLQPLRPRADVAVVTNFRANHLDRHGTIDAYRAAKQLLLSWQSPRDIAVLNRDDPEVSKWPRCGRTVEFGTESLHRSCEQRAERAVVLAGSDLLFVGDQPQASFPLRQRRGPTALNAAAAAAAAFAIGVDAPTIVESLNAFRGLPHRLEELGEFDGRTWVNDSKATTPEAAIAAIQAFRAPIRLIAGGADKGIDLTPLVEAIRASGVHVYLSGQTAKAIASQLVPHAATVARFATFDESVRAARSDSRPGDVILLSPGCASWGQFPDYRARGDHFRRLAGDPGPA
jgi:UDP-N-acetylmuramoylalanine--D-glutamate ligase